MSKDKFDKYHPLKMMLVWIGVSLISMWIVWTFIEFGITLFNIATK